MTSATEKIDSPPQIHSLIVFVLIVASALVAFPSLEEIDKVATIEAFTTPILSPGIFDSLLLMGCVRILFAVAIYCTTATNMINGNIVNPTYLPKSKLKSVAVEFKGLHSQGFFTQWSWITLGLANLSAGAIALIVYSASLSGNTPEVNPWLLRFALVTFEIAAPNALLVSSVVKYALWPVVLSKGGPKATANFKTNIGYMMHNFNIIVVVAETFWIGGTPVKFSHFSFVTLFGAAYVLFSWVMRNQWKPDHSHSVFLYFLLDTTLGLLSTIMLSLLVVVLLTFHFGFSCMELLVPSLDGNVFLHGLASMMILAGTNRWRD